VQGIQQLLLVVTTAKISVHPITVIGVDGGADAAWVPA